MQISASSLSSLSSVSPLKAKEAAQEATPGIAAPQPEVDTFTAATSWRSDESAALYKKPVQTPEPLSTAVQPDESNEKLADPTITATPVVEETVSQTAEATEPRTFGVKEFQQFLQQFGRQSGDEGFDAKMDLNGDGRVDGSDLSVVLANFRRS
jgi:hypothetical protein